jgi:hypothetical protein
LTLLPDAAEAELPGDQHTRDMIVLDRFTRNLVQASEVVRRRNENWWRDLETGEPVKRNVGELLMLVVSEIVEAMEGHRKNLNDNHLPEFSMFDVEIGDAIIRLLDLMSGLNRQHSIAEAFFRKMEYNRNRADHKIENRRGENGKKY